ncbi:MAG TPA: hypothetical protein VEZ48_02305 [Sphingomonadaceae bacterium]|nr:hypothetical protein [Sphingomonadaceae bacterium]
MAILLAPADAASAQDIPPLPPPPFAPDQGLAQPDPGLQALDGEWRLGRVDRRPARDPYTLTIWGSAFAAGRGCAIAQGQFRALGSERYRVERYGPAPEGCRRLKPPEPFDGRQLRLSGDRQGLTIRTADGREWMFAWVDVERTRASDDFLRGDWLLANDKGRPYRGAELTRVSFEQGYSVQAPNCSYETNGVSSERDWVVRLGGSHHMQTLNCRPRTIGDRLAQAGANAKITAEPVEGRLRVKVGGRSATLVPAARFPELSGGAKAYPVNAWARQLADVAARLPPGAHTESLMRALANGDALVGAGGHALQIAFSGYSIAEMDRMRLAGLPVDGLTRLPTERSFEELLLGVPIVAVAQLEAIQPVDRGDGLALDYRYRVVEGWRGGRRTGDLLIVRMPPLTGKSRSQLITPEPDARVLLLASRSGYLASTLREGRPPSLDLRVVSMTLPLIRVIEGRLAEAVKGTNVLGSARFEGMPLEEARRRARQLDAKATAAIAELKSQRRFRYFVSHIGPRALPDPTRLWFDYEPDLRVSGKPRIGAVTAWYDGCVTTRRVTGRASTTGVCPDSESETERAVGRAVAWIDAHGVPEQISFDGASETFAAITVPSDPPLTLRGAIR